MATLPVLMRATDMLVCGEDLGFLAPCVHPLMTELGLVGARPLRAPRTLLKNPSCNLHAGWDPCSHGCAGRSQHHWHALVAFLYAEAPP